MWTKRLLDVNVVVDNPRRICFNDHTDEERVEEIFDVALQIELPGVDERSVARVHENIKVRQMLHRSASTGSRPPTSLSVARRIVTEDGVSALYKGLSPALVRAVISGGGRLAGYNCLKGVCERAGWRHAPLLTSVL